MKNKKHLRDTYNFVLVWEIKDANVIPNTKKKTTRRDGDVNRSIRYGQRNGIIWSLAYLESIGLEQSWNYMVEHRFLQLKTSKNILWATPQNQLWIEKKIAMLFQNVFSFSLDLTSNLVFLDGFVHFPWLFRVKFQLAPMCRNRNTTEHDEKQEELEGYWFFGTSVRDTKRQRHL